VRFDLNPDLLPGSFVRQEISCTTSADRCNTNVGGVIA
jgi:hypothetical protein